MKKSALFMLILVISALVIVGVDSLDEPVHTEIKTAPNILPPITVIEVSAQSYQGHLQVLGEALPKWQVTLKSHVRGIVEQLPQQVQAGNRIKAGQFLMKVEDSSYRSQIAEAKQQIAEARLSVLQQKQKSEQDKLNWRRANLKGKPSDLALNKPQVANAEASLLAAKANLKVAEKQFGYTRIRAPFDAFITRRHISIGQSIEQGDELLNLISYRDLDIKIALSETQMNMLPQNWKQQTVRLLDLQQQPIAKAKLSREEGFLNPQTRLYEIYLNIATEDKGKVKSGSFLKVDLPTRKFDQVMIVPESSLTRKGQIWWVDENQLLRKFKATALLYDQGKVVIAMPEAFKQMPKTQWQIARQPLSFFLVGKKVTPKTVASSEELKP